MKKSNKYETNQFIGKFLWKELEEDFDFGKGYTFLSLTFNDFKNSKYEIDKWYENTIFEIFVPKEEWSLLNSLQEGDIVTYSAKFPILPKDAPAKISFDYLLQKGMRYWNFKHYEDKQAIGKLYSLLDKIE